MLNIVSLVTMQQSSQIPRCEANRPWSFIGVLNEVVRGIIAVVLDMHGPIEQVLRIYSVVNNYPLRTHCNYAYLVIV
jgi:hypothetical protein